MWEDERDGVEDGAYADDGLVVRVSWMAPAQ